MMRLSANNRLVREDVGVPSQYREHPNVRNGLFFALP
jgi:hypothetical protein